MFLLDTNLNVMSVPCMKPAHTWFSRLATSLLVLLHLNLLAQDLRATDSVVMLGEPRQAHTNKLSVGTEYHWSAAFVNQTQASVKVNITCKNAIDQTKSFPGEKAEPRAAVKEKTQENVLFGPGEKISFSYETWDAKGPILEVKLAGTGIRTDGDGGESLPPSGIIPPQALPPMPQNGSSLEEIPLDLNLTKYMEKVMGILDGKAPKGDDAGSKEQRLRSASEMYKHFDRKLKERQKLNSADPQGVALRWSQTLNMLGNVIRDLDGEVPPP